LACGVVMAVIAVLLSRHHAFRPTWGLRWLGAAWAGGLVSNLFPLFVQVGALRATLDGTLMGYVGWLALLVGFAGLAAMVVGIQCYVLRPPKRPWWVFAGFLVLSVIFTRAGHVLLDVSFAGEVIAAGVFLYVAWLTFSASQREPGVGHALLGLAFMTQSVTLCLLLLFQKGLQDWRFFSTAPYTAVGFILLSASLMRIRGELERELDARRETEQAMQEAQRALHRSHDVQQALLQQAPLPMAYSPVVAGQLPRTYWNQTWYTVFGYVPSSKEGLSGADFDYYVDPEDRDHYVTTVLELGHAGPFEVRFKHALGDIKLCQMQGTLINSDEEQFVITSFFDITEQRANELHLREFEAMVRSADDGIFFIENGSITAVNPAMLRIFGVETEALVGRSPVDWSPVRQADGRTSAEAAQAYIEAAQRGEPQRFHWQHCRASGEEFTAQVALTAVQGAPGRLVAVLRDVSEDLQKTATLAHSEARFKSIIAVSNTGAWEFHGSTSYLWCSPEYFTMLGLDPADFVMDGGANLQQAWVDLLHPDDAPLAARRFTDYLQGGSVGMYESQFRMRHVDGHWVWIWSRGQTLRHADGHLTDVTVGTHINITEQKWAEQQLAKARQMAEAIARAQLEFIVQQDRRKSFDGLLADILALADSEYGFIGEVLRNPQGQPYLKTFAITNIAWNDATRAFYEANAPKGMEFTNLHTLFGEVMKSGRAVVANDPYHDSRRGGLPDGHPALNAFLGVPVYHGDELVGMFGISNRPGGYDQQVIDYLHPLTATIGQLVAAMRSQIRQQETEVRLNSISNNLPNSMVYQLDCGEDGSMRQFTYLSNGIEHLHGLSHADVLRDASLLYAQIHPEDLPQLAAKEAACIQSLSEFNTEYRGRGPDGTERWFYVSSTPSRNAQNHIVWDGIEIDITARKRAEAALELSRLQLKASLDHTPTVAVQWFDREGRVLYWNPTSETMYGVAASEVLGQLPIGTLYPNETEFQGLLDVIREIEASGKAYGPYEVDIHTRDGRVVSVLATTFPVPMGEGQTAFVCMDVDITARKQAQRALQELNQTLEARVAERTAELTRTLEHLQRAQDELIQSEKLAALGSLVAGVAHELNTPIGNAVMVSSTMVDAHEKFREKVDHGSLSRAALKEFVHTVGEAGIILGRNLERAADLVSSFKQVAVDQSNHQRREFALGEILTEVQLIMAPGLRKAQVALRIDLGDAVSVDSFPGALTQALMILINNAIAHAFEGREGGSVRISATLAGADRVQIVVADDGVGIPQSRIGRIFEPFFTTKLGKGGSGLGLHICYNLVTATLGGRLAAESVMGQGTRMLIDIPRTAPEPASVPSPMQSA